MRQLYDSGYPVPRVLALEGDSSPLGRPIHPHGTDRRRGYVAAAHETRPASSSGRYLTLFCDLFVRLPQAGLAPLCRADPRATSRTGQPTPSSMPGWAMPAPPLPVSLCRELAVFWTGSRSSLRRPAARDLNTVKSRAGDVRRLRDIALLAALEELAARVAMIVALRRRRTFDSERRGAVVTGEWRNPRIVCFDDEAWPAPGRPTIYESRVRLCPAAVADVAASLQGAERGDGAGSGAMMHAAAWPLAGLTIYVKPGRVWTSRSPVTCSATACPRPALTSVEGRRSR